MLVKKLTNQITDFDNVELELNSTVIEWDDHQIFSGGAINKHFYYKDNILRLMVDYDTLVIYNENIPLSAGYYIGTLRDSSVENGFDFHIVEYYADLPDLATVAAGESYVVIKDDNLHRSGTYEATAETWKFIACLAPSDHGSLSGLGDDDHPIYHNDARGDVRYYRKDEYVDGQVAGSGPVKTNAQGKLGALLLNEIPHSTFTNLDQDDHPIYIPVNGSRGMDASYTPDTDEKVATKKYVDDTVNSAVGSGESKVRITAADTTSRYLDSAIEVDNKIIKSVQNPGGDETLRLEISNVLFDKTTDTMDDITNGATWIKGTPVDETNQDGTKNKLISNAMAYNWNQSIQNNADNLVSTKSELVGMVAAFPVPSKQGWLLCDGKTIHPTDNGADYTGEEFTELYNLLISSNSSYLISGNYAKLPDLRGRFVRGINDNNDVGGDPDGIREPGEIIPDGIPNHYHSINNISGEIGSDDGGDSVKGGAHYHFWEGETAEDGEHTHGIPLMSGSDEPTHYAQVAAAGSITETGQTNTDGSTHLHYLEIEIDAQGGHLHQVTVGDLTGMTDDEIDGHNTSADVRPVNVTLYYLIKY